jgi:hypothetical protein
VIFPVQTLRCDQHEARIYGVANKKPLFNCVYIFTIFPLKKVTFAVRSEKKRKQEKGRISDKKKVKKICAL